MSQVDDVDAELRLLHVQYLIVFTKWWLCGTYGIAKCSSNVHFLIHLYTLTERSSSVWSMSPLSSPSRMETAPGFSPCRLAMPHCGRSCLVLNFPVNKWNQHPSARAGRCRAMTSQRTFWDGQVPASSCCLKYKTPDEVASTHGWEWLLYALVF